VRTLKTLATARAYHTRRVVLLIMEWQAEEGKFALNRGPLHFEFPAPSCISPNYCLLYSAPSYIPPLLYVVYADYVIYPTKDPNGKGQTIVNRGPVPSSHLGHHFRLTRPSGTVFCPPRTPYRWLLVTDSSRELVSDLVPVVGYEDSHISSGGA